MHIRISCWASGLFDSSFLAPTFPPSARVVLSSPRPRSQTAIAALPRVKRWFELFVFTTLAISTPRPTQGRNNPIFQGTRPLRSVVTLFVYEADVRQTSTVHRGISERTSWRPSQRPQLMAALTVTIEHSRAANESSGKEFSVISIGGTCYRTRAVGSGGHKPVLDETLVLDPVNLNHTDIDIQVPPGSRVWVDLKPCPSLALPDEQRTPQQSNHETPSLRLRVYHHWSARNAVDPAGSSTQQYMQHLQHQHQQQQHNTQKLSTLVDGVQGLADKLGLWPCLDPANWVTTPRLAHLVGVLCDPLGHLLDTQLRHREDLTVHSASPSPSGAAAAAASAQAQLPCSCGVMACGPAEALCAPGDMLQPLPVGSLSPAMAKAWSRKTL